MKYLLDTHTVLWYIGEDPQLPASLRKQIEDRSNSCFVNIASLWEIGMVSCDKQSRRYDVPVIWNRSTTVKVFFTNF